MIVVTLTPGEVSLSILKGGGREQRRRADGDDHLYGLEKNAYNDWGRHIEAVGAELAFARYRNVYFNPPLVPDGAHDVDGFQVRQTCYPNGHLHLHEKDTGPAVLVTGTLPLMRIIGWIDADEGREAGEYRDVHGNERFCWWVAQRLLARFDDEVDHG